jgi:hypothetical protein
LREAFAGWVRDAVPANIATDAAVEVTPMGQSFFGGDDRGITHQAVLTLRKARATDFYTLRGDAAGETWTPRFTYHGFQFVELTGLAAKPELDAITGLVLHNDTPLAGSFECSDPVLTQFGRNAQWTQRANFVEVPTDCPQRDERLGWTGDSALTNQESAYNYDMHAFYNHWAHTLDDSLVANTEDPSFKSGSLPDTVPDIVRLLLPPSRTTQPATLTQILANARPNRTRTVCRTASASRRATSSTPSPTRPRRRFPGA